jgi:hypothetical protein
MTTKVEIKKKDGGRVKLVLHPVLCQIAYYHVFIQVALSLENTMFHCPRSRSTGCFNKINAFTALRLTGPGAPLAEERMRILPMTQHADNIWNDGKFLPLFTDNRRC